MIHSIRTRLAITYLVLILVILGLVTVITTNYLQDYLVNYSQQQLTNKAFLLADSVAGFLEQQPDQVAASQLAESLSMQLGARVLILNGNLEVVGDSLRVGGLLGYRMQRKETLTALQGGVGRSVQYSQNSQQWVLQLAVPLPGDDGGPIGVLFVSSSLSQSYTILRFILRLLLYVTLASAGVAVVLSLLLTNNISKPLLQLTRAAEDLGQGRLDRRIEVRGRDELASLSIQFNRMAEQVERYTEKLKEFVANASHELRTPLTSLRLQVQSLRDYPMTDRERDEFLQDMENELERLSNLVDDLLALSRLDRQEKPELKPLELGEVLRQTAAEMAPQIEAAGLSFIINIVPEPVIVAGDKGQLKEALLNLLENALKYTPVGGEISLSLLPRREEAVVEVADTGIGIPLEEQDKIFERFYRVDKARSRAQGGTGLGLAIAREIVALHGGRIWVESKEKQGSRFYIVLPRNIKKN